MYNDIIEYEVTTDLSAEPVTLEEFKRHLNMLFDTDQSYEFDDDDTYLEIVLKAARRSMERYTGVSFGEKTITAILRNELGNIEIPFGPILTITSVKDSKGNALTLDSGYSLSGSKFKKLVSPTYDYVEVTYTAGYTELPDDLKLAILHEGAHRYNHRGDEKDSDSYSKSALELASPYKRTAWLT